MKARQVFTALMASKGYTESDLAMSGDKYDVPAMQGRWNYFLLGWEMRGDVIETVLIIFGLGFLGITLAISVICFMVWLALNES